MARPKEKETINTKTGSRTYKLKKDRKTKNTGRPSKLNDELVKKLEELLMVGCHVEEACETVGISGRSFYEYKSNNEDFSQRMDRAKQYALVLSRKVIVKGIRDGDKQLAKRYVEHKDPEFKNATRITAVNESDDEGTTANSLQVEIVGV